MMLYLIKSGLCLAVILGIYHLVLEREKMYRFNRYFLLFGLCFSFIAPLISLGYVPSLLGEDSVFQTIPGHDSRLVPMVESPAATVSTFNITFLLIAIYAIVTCTQLFRFFYSLGCLLKKAVQNQKVPLKGAKLVLIKEKLLPYTFGNYIFVSKEAYTQQQIETELFTHELAHVHQRHSLDILLIEAVQVLFWFNPMLIAYKRAIQLNHEFLADDQVIKSHKRIIDYQNLLLDKASWSKKEYLASNFNYLVTKKRLIMMTKNTSRLRAFVYGSCTIPLFIFLLLLFGGNATAQTAITEDKKTDLLEIKAAYFKNATFECKNKDGQKIYQSYQALTEQEKKDLPPPPPQVDGKPNPPLAKGTLIRIGKNGMVYKSKSDAVPPPPPPPPPSKKN